MEASEHILQVLSELDAKVSSLIRAVNGLEELIKKEHPDGGPAAPARRKCTVVFAQYPDFEKHYDWLLSSGYISETAGGLTWNKSKQSLAEYFIHLTPDNAASGAAGGAPDVHSRKRRWQDIEALFNVKGLKHCISLNGDMFKKPSRDYEELTRLIAAKIAPEGK